MKTLLRLCSAAALVAAAAACGNVPTAMEPEIAPARFGGGIIGGGYRIANGDTVTVTTVSNDLTTTSTTGCVEERGGGWVGGGGHYTEPTCP